MTEDRSLDEFVGAGADTGDSKPAENSESAEEAREGGSLAADDAPTERADDPAGEVVVDGVSPAWSTATWTADGAACDRCGEVVERRWLEDELVVCGDCKSW